jgi:ABC-2 type transport system ATP-binding protein
MVGTRTIRATLAGVEVAALQALPGVSSVERRGEAAVLHCADSDAAIRALLAAYPDARDIEIAAAGLEQAFLALTGDGETQPSASAGAPSEREQR